VTDYGLTPFQHKVLKELLKGKSNREIAEALNITIRAVKGRMICIAIKYGVAKRHEIVTKHHGIRS